MKKLFMILPLALILFFMVGCQDKEALAELDEFRAQAAVEEQNLEFARKVLEEFNKKNIEFFMEVNAPDYRFYYPSGNPNPISHEEMIEMAKMYWEAFPDLIYHLEESMAAGDKVISMLIAKGTHKGELPGIPATRKEIEISVILDSKE